MIPLALQSIPALKALEVADALTVGGELTVEVEGALVPKVVTNSV